MNQHSAPTSPIQNSFNKRFGYAKALTQVASIAVKTTQPLNSDNVMKKAQFLGQAVDILRMEFSHDDFGLTWQKVSDTLYIAVDHDDWSNLSDAEVQGRCEKLHRLFQGRNVEPWLHLHVGKLPREKYLLSVAMPLIHADLFTLHHVAEVLINESLQSQHGSCVQYTDIAPWLNEFLLDEELADARRFWDEEHTRACMTGQFGLVNYKNSSSQVSRYQSVCIPLGEEYLAVRTFAAQQGTDAEHVIAASLRREVSRYADDSRMVRVVDSRHDQALRAALGPMSRALPIKPEPAESLVESVVHECTAMQQSQDYIECYAKPADMELQSFPFVFAHLKGDSRGALEVSYLDWLVEQCQCQFTFIEQGDKSLLHIQFSPAFMSAKTAHDMGLRWLARLCAEVANTGIAKATLSTCAATLQGPSPTPADGFFTVVDWFEQQVAVTGNSQIVTPDESIRTYHDIHLQSNKLAHLLLSKGVTAGDHLAICLERGADFLIAVLATCKVGAAYIPIDVDLPRARITYMLENAEATLVIGKGIGGLVVLPSIDLLTENFQPFPSVSLDIQIKPEDTAYLIYTSGSTGTPKGIKMCHNALLNHMRWMIAEFQFGLEDTVVQRTSLSFDASIWEYWVPLLSGAKLLMVPTAANYNLKMLRELMARHDATILQMVPPHLSTLLQDIHQSNTGSDKTKEISRLRILFSGGEQLENGLAQQAVNTFQTQLVNLYGPSECCIQAVYWRYDTELILNTVPIGNAIDNVSLTVVDPSGNAVGYGEQGELWIGGQCLFSGYQNAPELTEKAWGQLADDDTLYYRTGDLVRVLHDGTLSYVERLDNQVKINGFRIELIEVARLAESLPSCEKAICLHEAATDSLVLFYVGEAMQNEIESTMNTHLPAYMCANQIVQVDTFPILPNGKTDRRALHEIAKQKASQTYIEPTTEIERETEAIWRENFGKTDPISIESNFFSVGGHSLLAIKVISKLNKHFGTRLTLKELFEYNTIRSLAEFIQNVERNTTPTSSEPQIPSLGLTGEEQTEEFEL